MSDVTRILSAIEQGDLRSADQLLPLVYDELRKLAAQKLASEKSGQTLDATALVHEAYLRLAGQQQPFSGRGHFFAAAAEAMRRILIDNARRKRSLKRGGGVARQDLDEAELVAPEVRDDVLALDEALTRLSETDKAASQLVQLRYFAGLSVPEAAEVLGVSQRAAERLWTYARAWLHRTLHAPGSADDHS
jgi:RNA polymerase sigma factor (TIGR02999 family)